MGHPTGLQGEMAWKGDPVVGKASELQKELRSSGSSVSILGCNHLHCPQPSPKACSAALPRGADEEHRAGGLLLALS